MHQVPCCPWELKILCSLVYASPASISWIRLDPEARTRFGSSARCMKTLKACANVRCAAAQDASGCLNYKITRD